MPSTYDTFRLVSDFELRGDQARAIDELGGPEPRRRASGAARRDGFRQDVHDGAGHRAREPADPRHGAQQDAGAQPYQEFKRFFPENAVEHFVSYYDYYQPEAYVPATDCTSRRKRRSTTRSIACGCRRRGRSSSGATSSSSPACRVSTAWLAREAYYGMMLPLEQGQKIGREQILRKLVEIQHERNDHEFARGAFRVRGDIVEVYPSAEDTAVTDRALWR